MTRSSSGPSPTERVEDTAAVLRALKKAVREALRQHKQAGNPVAVWRNGRVEWIQPADIPATNEDEGD